MTERWVTPEEYAHFDAMSLAQLGEEMVAADAEVERIEESLKAAKARLEFLQVRAIPAKLDAEGLRNFRLASGKGITVVDQMFVSAKAGQSEAMMDWLRENGADSLIKPTVNANTLKAFVKERMENMQDIPVDLLNVSVVPKARFFR